MALIKQSENLVRKSSDILGYNISLNNTNLGIKLKLAGGYDYFHNYLFNSLSIRCGNFTEF